MRRVHLAGDRPRRCRRRAARRRRASSTRSRRPSRARAVDAHLAADLPALEVRRPAERADRGRGHALEPDGLPDPGRARVPDRVRLEQPVLLAARLGEVVRIVVGAHDDRRRRRGRASAVGDVDRERRVAALVPPDERAVDPDRRRVVDRAEVEQQPLAGCERGRLERAPVPARRDRSRCRRCRSPASRARTAPMIVRSHATSVGRAPARRRGSSAKSHVPLSDVQPAPHAAAGADSRGRRSTARRSAAGARAPRGAGRRARRSRIPQRSPRPPFRPARKAWSEL